MEVCGEAVGKYHDEHGESLPQHRRLRFYLPQFTIFFPRKLYWRGASRFSMQSPSANVSEAETSEDIGPDSSTNEFLRGFTTPVASSLHNYHGVTID